jgi:Transcriptional repressor TCF25
MHEQEGGVVLSLLESKLPIGESPTKLQQLELQRQLDHQLQQQAAGTNSSSSSSSTTATTATTVTQQQRQSEGAGLSEEQSAEQSSAERSVTVQDLPGLALSSALALLQRGDTPAARSAMCAALLRFPAVLEPVLNGYGNGSPRVSAHPVNWKAVFQCAHFGAAASRCVSSDSPVHLHHTKVITSFCITVVLSTIDSDARYC